MLNGVYYDWIRFFLLIRNISILILMNLWKLFFICKRRYPLPASGVYFNDDALYKRYDVTIKYYFYFIRSNVYHCAVASRNRNERVASVRTSRRRRTRHRSERRRRRRCHRHHRYLWRRRTSEITDHASVCRSQYWWQCCLGFCIGFVGSLRSHCQWSKVGAASCSRTFLYFSFRFREIIIFVFVCWLVTKSIKITTFIRIMVFCWYVDCPFEIHLSIFLFHRHTNTVVVATTHGLARQFSIAIGIVSWRHACLSCVLFWVKHK